MCAGSVGDFLFRERTQGKLSRPPADHQVSYQLRAGGSGKKAMSTFCLGDQIRGLATIQQNVDVASDTPASCDHDGGSWTRRQERVSRLADLLVIGLTGWLSRYRLKSFPILDS